MHLLSKFELKIPQSYPQTAFCHSFITNWSQNTFSELRVNMPGLPAKLPDMEQIFLQLWEFRPLPPTEFNVSKGCNISVTQTPYSVAAITGQSFLLRSHRNL